ncbi:MAG: triple tyrosine motif-containing protein [Thermoplasmatota archaeon]
MNISRTIACVATLLIFAGIAAPFAEAQPYVINGYISVETDGDPHPVTSFSMRVINRDADEVLENHSQHIYRNQNYYQVNIGHPNPGWSIGDHIEIQVEGYGQWQGFSTNSSFVFNTYPYPPVNLTLIPSTPEAPTRPSGPSSGYVNVSYTFSASASDPNGYNLSYGWDWDGDDVVDEWTELFTSGDTCTASHTWTGQGAHTVRIKARNEYNATGNWSKPLDVTISQDTTPPSVWITGGPEGVITYSNVTFTWAGEDDISPSSKLRYRYALDGYSPAWTDWQAATTATYSDLPSDAYTFKLQVKDGQGNVLSRTLTRSFTVERDTVPPSVSITAGPTGVIHKRSATFTWTGSDDVAGNNDLTYTYRLQNHSDWTAWTGNTTASYPSLVNDTYTFQLRPRDPAGNVGATVAQAFTVAVSSNDTTPPSIEVTTPEPEATVTGTIDIQWNATDAGQVSVAISVSPDNGSTWQAVTANVTAASYTWDTTLLDNGRYLLRLTATDDAGNLNATTLEVTVDNANGTPAFGLAALVIAVLAAVALFARKKNH